MSAQLTIKDLKSRMETGATGNRKRQSSTSIENPPKRIALAAVACNAFEDSMFQRRNGSTKVYAGRKKTAEHSAGDSNFSKPSQILRDCKGIAFDLIRPALLQCSSTQKLKFIHKNSHFAKEADDIFREATIAEFEGITKLPARFQYWYKYYESLVNWTKNEEVSKLEELIAKAAENKKQAQNGRKTMIIDTVHTGKRCRPTEVSVRISAPTAQQSSIAQQSVRTQKPIAIKKSSSNANPTQKSSTTIKTSVPRITNKKPTYKPAPMWKKCQKQMKQMRK